MLTSKLCITKDKLVSEYQLTRHLQDNTKFSLPTIEEIGSYLGFVVKVVIIM